MMFHRSHGLQEALGFWRCLLIKGPSTADSPNVQHCWNVLVSRKTGPIKLAERNQALLCALVDAQEFLSDSEMLDGLNHIAAETEMTFSDPMAQQALKVLRAKLRQASSSSKASVQYSILAKFSTGQIAKLKVAEVKQLLAAEGLSTDGLKKALVERLVAAREAALVDELKATMHEPRREASGGFSTILILSHQLQQFPWEGMDVMRGCSGVTRMPSLDRIVQNAKRPLVVRQDRVRFLLNPAGDLKSTQDQLGPILDRGAATYGWEGVVGEIPDPDELRYASCAPVCDRRYVSALGAHRFVHLVLQKLFISCRPVYLLRPRLGRSVLASRQDPESALGVQRCLAFRLQQRTSGT
jgi:hypothetical protein